MKSYRNLTLLAAIVCLFGTIASINAQSTTFTYQGRLSNGANPANGNYDLTFALFNVNIGAGQVGDTITNTALPVSNGLFTVTLDFGTNFSGANRWLEIGVRSNGVGAFDTLTPRQLITATPYAITAGNLTGSLPASQLTGALSSAQLSGTYVGTVNFSSPANSYAGDGGNLTNVNAALLGGLSAGSFWKLPGNAGTTAGTHFLGTTDNQPLELKVNNQRGLRIEPGIAPSFIAGSSNNLASGLSWGAAIGGGDSNRIYGTTPFGTIGGGQDNLIEIWSEGSTIGGGQANHIDTCFNSTIGGGIGNWMPGQAERSVIGGGANNRIDHTDESTIGGGKGNRIRNGRYATISGGAYNFVDSYRNSTIGGGMSNRIYDGSANATIGGGFQNSISTNAYNATISGGNLNTIFGTNSTIAGGFSNTVDAINSTIGGGVENRIYSLDLPHGAPFNTISGGGSNSIQGVTGATAFGNSIGGGTENVIWQHTTHNTIGGGFDNGIASDSKRSVIGGGGQNVLDGDNGTIAGGFANQILAYVYYAGSIGGGRFNLIQNCNDATIGGGLANYTSTDYSTISGGVSNRMEARYAAIPGGMQARATRFGQLAYASGQFAAAGDAQTSIHVCRGITADATQTELFVDGIQRSMVMPINSTWTYDILVTGRTTTGDSAGYQIRGVIERNAGTAAQVGIPDVTVLTEDVPAWNATVAAANSQTNALVIQVTGAAATTIRWVASVRTVEVTH